MKRITFEEALKLLESASDIIVTDTPCTMTSATVTTEELEDPEAPFLELEADDGDGNVFRWSFIGVDNETVEVEGDIMTLHCYGDAINDPGPVKVQLLTPMQLDRRNGGDEEVYKRECAIEENLNFILQHCAHAKGAYAGEVAVRIGEINRHAGKVREAHEWLDSFSIRRHVPTNGNVVCLVGSSRFMEEHNRVAMDETLVGNVVLGMSCFGHADYPPGAKAITSDSDESNTVKQLLDRLHLQKIDMASEVVVVRVSGYVGSGAQREIDYARANGKIVRYADFDKELAQERTIPPRVLAALLHVNLLYPDVDRVTYWADGRWQYSSDGHETVVFDNVPVDVSILEEAIYDLPGDAWPLSFQLSEEQMDTNLPPT